jgi:hypothetical protein
MVDDFLVRVLEYFEPSLERFWIEARGCLTMLISVNMQPAVFLVLTNLILERFRCDGTELLRNFSRQFA